MTYTFQWNLIHVEDKLEHESQEKGLGDYPQSQTSGDGGLAKAMV